MKRWRTVELTIIRPAYYVTKIRVNTLTDSDRDSFDEATHNYQYGVYDDIIEDAERNCTLVTDVSRKLDTLRIVSEEDE